MGTDFCIYICIYIYMIAFAWNFRFLESPFYLYITHFRYYRYYTILHTYSYFTFEMWIQNTAANVSNISPRVETSMSPLPLKMPPIRRHTDVGFYYQSRFCTGWTARAYPSSGSDKRADIHVLAEHHNSANLKIESTKLFRCVYFYSSTGS